MAGRSYVSIGAQYGDEGKGKITDILVSDGSIPADIIARYNGANNAGHNVHTPQGNIILHAIPGFFQHQEKIGYIGSGCVVLPEKTRPEISEIEERGYSLKGRLFISAKCTLVQPADIFLDKVTGKEVGTTGNGIGPAYARQAQRQIGGRLMNIRLGDYLENTTEMQEAVRKNLEEVCQQYKIPADTEAALEIFDAETKALAKYVCRDPLFLLNLIEEGKHVLFEGANAVMLDAVTGDVPFVTSSRTIAAGAYTGGDLPPNYHAKTIAVAKALMSRVGNGPFIAELGGERSEEYCKEEGGYKYTKEKEAQRYDIAKLLKSQDPFEQGIALRILSGEYGATTGRPRRIGMLDLVMLRQNCKQNGVDELYLTKVDALELYSRTLLPGIPVVVGYELDGQKSSHLPSTVTQSRRVKPVVEYLPHIHQNIFSARKPEDLPGEVKEFLSFVENFVGVPICGIGVGPGREEFVRMK